MELVLSLVALVAGGAALALVFDTRGKTNQIEQLRKRVNVQQHALEAAQQDLRSLQVEIETTRNQLGDLDRGLDLAQRELDEVKAAANALPAPPLPRARSAGLDDLREQLRAAHRESDESDDT